MFNDFEKSIHEYAEVLINTEFKVDGSQFFHYTSPASATAIIDSQIFQASFIRSSSDSLEFSAPMAACRDWICLTPSFFIHSAFPLQLFKHFNEEAIDPTARPYFISLSTDPNSGHLKSMYGDTQIPFKINFNATEFRMYGFLVKCKYVEDIRIEVFRLLDKWKNEVFERALELHKIGDPMAYKKDWFYTLMQFCNTISAAIKQKAFEQEDESRVVVFTRSPDQDSAWHKPRAVKKVSEKSLLMREYLPLILNGAGFAVGEQNSK